MNKRSRRTPISAATDPRVAFFTFIGSAKVGWYLRSQLPAGTRFALEHGGAAPVIVDRLVDLETLIEPLVKGGYYHAGQVCVSVQHTFVHNDLKIEFIQRFSARVQRLSLGEPRSIDTEVGPLIAPREVNRVAQWVGSAIAEGATLTVGGHTAGERLYQPTVLVEPNPASLVSISEILGRSLASTASLNYQTPFTVPIASHLHSRLRSFPATLMLLFTPPAISPPPLSWSTTTPHSALTGCPSPA